MKPIAGRRRAPRRQNAPRVYILEAAAGRPPRPARGRAAARRRRGRDDERAPLLAGAHVGVEHELQPRGVEERRPRGGRARARGGCSASACRSSASSARAGLHVELAAHEDPRGAIGKLTFNREWTACAYPGTRVPGFRRMFYSETLSKSPRPPRRPAICSIASVRSVYARRASTTPVCSMSELVANAVEHVDEDGDIEVRIDAARRRAARSRCSIQVRASRYAPRAADAGQRPRMGPACSPTAVHALGRSTPTAARACGSSCRAYMDAEFARYREVP